VKELMKNVEMVTGVAPFSMFSDIQNAACLRLTRLCPVIPLFYS